MLSLWRDFTANAHCVSRVKLPPWSSVQDHIKNGKFGLSGNKIKLQSKSILCLDAMLVEKPEEQCCHVASREFESSAVENSSSLRIPSRFHRDSPCAVDYTLCALLLLVPEE